MRFVLDCIVVLLTFTLVAPSQSKLYAAKACDTSFMAWMNLLTSNVIKPLPAIKELKVRAFLYEAKPGEKVFPVYSNPFLKQTVLLITPEDPIEKPYFLASKNSKTLSYRDIEKLIEEKNYFTKSTPIVLRDLSPDDDGFIALSLFKQNLLLIRNERTGYHAFRVKENGKMEDLGAQSITGFLDQFEDLKVDIDGNLMGTRRGLSEARRLTGLFQIHLVESSR